MGGLLHHNDNTSRYLQAKEALKQAWLQQICDLRLHILIAVLAPGLTWEAPEEVARVSHIHWKKHEKNDAKSYRAKKVICRHNTIYKLFIKIFRFNLSDGVLYRTYVLCKF